jgi:hypothetical protein
MEVYISSGTHVDEISSRTNDIHKNIEDIDIVFGEGATDTKYHEQVDILRLFLRAPPTAAFLLFYILYSGFLGIILSKLSNGKTARDKEMMENLAVKYDVETQEIDTAPIFQHIYDHSVLWGVTNWGALIFISYTRWPATPTITNMIEYIGPILLFGVLCLGALLAIMHDTRDKTMADEVISEHGSYDRACVIVGEAHHLGVGRHLDDCSSIDVINPEPEDQDTITQILLDLFALINSFRRSN